MIEIRIIPDGTDRLPAMAKNDDVVANLLASNNPGDASGGSSLSSWREIERHVTVDELRLRMPGNTPGNESSSTKDAVVLPIVDNIPNLTTHPSGWQPVDE